MPRRPPEAAAAEAVETLDARIRRLDPDRWLASRFVPDPATRATVVAVYALNDELARVAESVSNPLAGEIRLAWWRERIEAIAVGGAPPGQPVLQALASAIASGVLPPTLLDTLVEARHAELEPAPFADDAALARYLDGTAGAVMGLAARVLDPEAPLRAIVEAGRAWGLAGLYRTRAIWRSRARDWVPQSWGEPDEAGLASRATAEVQAALARARVELKALPVAAFPAVAYAGLAEPYARGRAPGELTRRFRLLVSVLRGQV
ncbi:squalene/phytoene synthase family protein [Caulobacter sp. S45]|uniref:phytoene/squalene synthase family protein n=1 Tax=Caulobacter sp. S45 TaxID=1641861 RepID=UPI0020C64329|nr:squalene/phytoene synthase family protein [Caulobacter sp. S45]